MPGPSSSTSSSSSSSRSARSAAREEAAAALAKKEEEKRALRLQKRRSMQTEAAGHSDEEEAETPTESTQEGQPQQVNDTPSPSPTPTPTTTTATATPIPSTPSSPAPSISSPAPAVPASSGPAHRVECILAHRKVQGRNKFKVQWIDSAPTWEWEQNLRFCRDKIHEWKAQQKVKRATSPAAAATRTTAPSTPAGVAGAAAAAGAGQRESPAPVSLASPLHPVEEEEEPVSSATPSAEVAAGGGHEAASSSATAPPSSSGSTLRGRGQAKHAISSLSELSPSPMAVEEQKELTPPSYSYPSFLTRIDVVDPPLSDQDLKEDAYGEYLKRTLPLYHSSTSSAFSLLPPSSTQGVSACKVSVIHPLHDPLEMLWPLDGGRKHHRTLDKQLTGIQGLPWTKEEEQAWEECKQKWREWGREQASKQEARQAMGEESKEPPIHVSLPLSSDSPVQAPRVQLTMEGVSFTLVDQLPPAPASSEHPAPRSRARRRRLPVWEEEEEGSEALQAGAEQAHVSRPASPHPSARKAPAPISAAAAASAAMDLSSPRGSRRGMGGIAASTPLSTPARRNNQLGSTPSLTSPSPPVLPPSMLLTPRTTRSGAPLLGTPDVDSSPRASPRTRHTGSSASKLDALPPVYQHAIPPTPSSARLRTHARTGQSSSSSSSSSSHSQVGLPWVTRGPVSPSEELLLKEEAKLIKRKGHLTSAEGARLRFLTARPDRGRLLEEGGEKDKEKERKEGMATKDKEKKEEADKTHNNNAAKIGSSSTASSPSPSSSTPSPAPSTTTGTMNRRERRQLAREQGTLVQKSPTVHKSSASPSAPSSPAALALLAGNGSDPPALIPSATRRSASTSPSAALLLSTSGRSSRSQLDLSGVLMTPKDWPAPRKIGEGTSRRRSSISNSPANQVAVAKQHQLQQEAQRKEQEEEGGSTVPAAAAVNETTSMQVEDGHEKTSQKRKREADETSKQEGEAEKEVDEEEATAAPVKKLRLQSTSNSPLDPSVTSASPSSTPATSPTAAAASSSSTSSSSSSGPKLFLYGNYDRYYGYRNSSSSSGGYWSDARFPLLHAEWFTNKVVYDLGCNSGLLTILLASSREHAPRKVVGVELDETLVRKAREQVETRVRYLEARERRAAAKAGSKSNSPNPAAAAAGGNSPTSNIPVSSLSRLASPNTSLATSTSPSPSSSTTPSPAPFSPLFPSNLSFFTGDLLSYPLTPSSIDVVLLLSVTKWIHFHHGDAGIHSTFARIDAALVKGGLCILEPQPWRTYKKKANLNEEIKERYKSIQLKPEEFPTYVQQKHGWILKHTLYADGGKEGEGKGFKVRPIYVFEKP